MFELRTASPSVARLTDLAVWREREAFEEKTDRALVLLRKKDAKIRELGEALAKRNASIGRQRAANEKSSAAAAAAAPAGARDVGVYGGRRGDGGSRSVSRNGTAADGGAVVVARLEKCVEEQADQIEALLDEVTGSNRATWGSLSNSHGSAGRCANILSTCSNGPSFGPLKVLLLAASRVMGLELDSSIRGAKCGRLRDRRQLQLQSITRRLPLIY